MEKKLENVGWATVDQFEWLGFKHEAPFPAQLDDHRNHHAGGPRKDATVEDVCLRRSVDCRHTECDG